MLGLGTNWAASIANPCYATPQPSIADPFTGDNDDQNAGIAIVRRALSGRNPAAADAGHLHHRLRAVGLNPIETALTFYLVTGILGCLALTIYGHRRIIDVALGLLVVALAALIWRNRRRAPRLPFVAAIEESEVQVDGRRALPSHIHHRGEAD